MSLVQDNNMNSLNYKDVHLVPNKCIVKSRSECDTSIEFLGKKFKLPVVPANMGSVINESIAKYLSFNDYFYIMHRFLDNKEFIKDCNEEKWPIISISVGVQQSDRELIDYIVSNDYRVDFITIDIAHSFAESTSDIIGYIKSKIKNVKVIAGNICGDKQSIEFLYNAGVDCIKAGIGPGKGCSTYSKTGFCSPMFSSSLLSGKYANIPVILDGGIKEFGDIAKALVGFTSVQSTPTYGGYPKFKDPLNIPMIMIGSLFSACIDSPGENVYNEISDDELRSTASYRRMIDNVTSFSQDVKNDINNQLDNLYRNRKVIGKKYYGSASAENKEKTGQEVRNVEGVLVTLDCNNMYYVQFLESIKQAIQSQISYAGGNDLSCFKNVKWSELK